MKNKMKDIFIATKIKLKATYANISATFLGLP